MADSLLFVTSQSCVFVLFSSKATNLSLAFHLFTGSSPQIARRSSQGQNCSLSRGPALRLSVCHNVSVSHRLSWGSVSCPPPPPPTTSLSPPLYQLNESLSLYFSLSFLSLLLPLTASHALTQHSSCSDSSTSPLCRYHRQFLYFEWKAEQL